jgi:hypothetical protein
MDEYVRGLGFPTSGTASFIFHVEYEVIFPVYRSNSFVTSLQSQDRLLQVVFLFPHT